VPQVLENEIGQSHAHQLRSAQQEQGTVCDGVDLLPKQGFALPNLDLVGEQVAGRQQRRVD
jgi:hypothetical protein